MCDFIEIDEKLSKNEVIETYTSKYEQVRKSMGITSMLLPVIIHISFIGG